MTEPKSIVECVECGWTRETTERNPTLVCCGECEAGPDRLRTIDLTNPVVHLSDGPRLVLANGTVVRPIVKQGEVELAFAGNDRGAAMYGKVEDDATRTDIAYVDDPGAAEHDLVKKHKEALGVD